VYLNGALITWYSKCQPSVESLVFGAEFVALKNGMESVRGLQYKLHMMGVEIAGPTYARIAITCLSSTLGNGLNQG
jgi:hypothetical protein